MATGPRTDLRLIRPALPTEYLVPNNSARLRLTAAQVRQLSIRVIAGGRRVISDLRAQQVSLFSRTAMRRIRRKLRQAIWDELFESQRAGLPLLVEGPAPRPVDLSLTVVVITYNYGRHLAGCLDSILASSRTDFDILVIDPSSTDDTPEVLDRYLGDPRVRTVRRDQRHLIGCNRNLGIRSSKSRYVSFIDADDEVLPEYFEAATFVAELYEFDVVGAQLELFGDALGTWEGMPRFPTLKNFQSANGMPSQSVARVDALLAVDGFVDRGIGATLAFEDWAAWQRIAALGGRFANIGQRLIRYRVHGMSQSRQSEVSLAEVQAPEIVKSNLDFIRDADRFAWRPRADVVAPIPHSLKRRVADSARPILVVVAPYASVGGVMRMASHVIRSAYEQGWEVVVCATEYSDPSLAQLRSWMPPGVHIFCLNQMLRTEDYPIWFEYLTSDRSHSVLWDVGTPWLYGEGLTHIGDMFSTVIGTAVNTTHLDQQLRCATSYDAFVVESEHLLPPVLRAMSPAKTHFIPNGVDLTAWVSSERTNSEVRRRVLWAGRFSDEKDPLLFLEIAAAADRATWEFVMIGDGPMADEVKRRAVSAGVVVLTESWSVARELHESDVLMVTSIMEGTPNVILEAQASSRTVIAPAVGGIPRMITDGVDGMLVQERTVTAFLRALDSVAPADVRDEIGAFAHARVHRERDARVMAARYLKLFENGSSVAVTGAVLHEGASR